MKKHFFALLLLVCYNLLSAQELPEIPLKNGMAYYSFEHKLDNKTNCLSTYFDRKNTKSLSTLTKISDYTRIFNSKISKDKIGFSLAVGGGAKMEVKCSDTITSIKGLYFGTAGSNVFWKPLIIEFLSKRVTKSVVSANVAIVFTSKTDYILVIKDITYTIDYIKGGKHGIDYYKIGELYEQLKSSDKIKKDDIKFFENLNFFMQSADEIILKSLTDAYQADEL